MGFPYLSTSTLVYPRETLQSVSLFRRLEHWRSGNPKLVVTLIYSKYIYIYIYTHTAYIYIYIYIYICRQSSYSILIILQSVYIYIWWWWNYKCIDTNTHSINMFVWAASLQFEQISSAERRLENHLFEAMPTWDLRVDQWVSPIPQE